MAIQLIDKKPARKPRNVYINPDILYKAHVEALCARKLLGMWLEEAEEGKVKGEEKKVK